MDHSKSTIHGQIHLCPHYTTEACFSKCVWHALWLNTVMHTHRVMWYKARLHWFVVSWNPLYNDHNKSGKLKIYFEILKFHQMFAFNHAFFYCWFFFVLFHPSHKSGCVKGRSNIKSNESGLTTNMLCSYWIYRVHSSAAYTILCVSFKTSHRISWHLGNHLRHLTIYVKSPPKINFYFKVQYR